MYIVSKFGELPSNNLGVFAVLKRSIFAEIRQQFDDVLHSSSHRSKTDWKITILISAE